MNRLFNNPNKIITGGLARADDVSRQFTGLDTAFEQVADELDRSVTISRTAKKGTMEVDVSDVANTILGFDSEGNAEVTDKAAFLLNKQAAEAAAEAALTSSGRSLANADAAESSKDEAEAAAQRAEDAADSIVDDLTEAEIDLIRQRIPTDASTISIAPITGLNQTVTATNLQAAIEQQETKTIYGGAF